MMKERDDLINENEKQNAIARGRQKVWLPERKRIKMLQAKIKKEERELPDKVYEIIGSTEAKYYGYSNLPFLKCWQKYRGERGPKFCRYVHGEIFECTRSQALATPEYRRHRILLFKNFAYDYDKKGNITGEHMECNLALIKENPDAR